MWAGAGRCGEPGPSPTILGVYAETLRQTLQGGDEGVEMKVWR